MNSPVRVLEAWGTRESSPVSSLLGDWEEVFGRLLLQDAVYDLKAVDVPVLHGGLTLLEPADVGPQGHPEITYLAVESELFQGFEQLVPFQRVHPRVVDLVEVDVIGFQPAQALLAGVDDEIAVELLGALPVTVTRGRVVDVVTELGGDDDVVAPVAQDLGENLLAVAVAVGVGGIEEIHAQFHGVFQQRRPVGLLDPPPPVGGHGPDAESDL